MDDWATHSIGHELTAFLGMDHARTLACIQPRVLRTQFEAKKGKLAQMGRRVFGLEGEDEEVAEKAIEALVRFYEKDMNMPTRISAFVESEDRSWIDRMVEKWGNGYDVMCRFTQRGTVLGENKAITPEIARKIVEDSYFVVCYKLVWFYRFILFIKLVCIILLLPCVLLLEEALLLDLLLQ